MRKIYILKAHHSYSTHRNAKIIQLFRDCLSLLDGSALNCKTALRSDQFHFQVQLSLCYSASHRFFAMIT